MKKLFLLCFYLSMFFSGCKEKHDSSFFVEELAGENYSELQKVRDYFSNDPLKNKAAEFLIDNMFHSYIHSELRDVYYHRLLNSDADEDSEYNELWASIIDSLSPHPRQTVIYDAQRITAEYLIRNINEAFDVWMSSSWYSKIDFETFCLYILPYRVIDEPLSEWRSYLKNKYIFLIEGIADPRKAFAKVYSYLIKEFGTRSIKYPFTPDVLLSDRLMTGTCAQRCTYIICVMRSLGIPASFDLIQYWANYSTSGHSWVSYVPNSRETYTMMPYDSIPKMYNTIDASQFSSREISKESRYYYDLETLKRVSKVFRYSYRADVSKVSFKYIDRSIPEFFSIPFIEDVSSHYKQTDNTLRLSLNNDMITNARIQLLGESDIFLCTFASILDWQAAAIGRIQHGKAIFSNIGKDIVVLPVLYDEFGEIYPLSNPLLVKSRGCYSVFNPDTLKSERMVLRRKYILYAHWLKRWEKMVNTRFEASDFADFREVELLHMVSQMPEGIMSISVNPSKAYRYIRMIVRDDARPDLGEVRYYGKFNQRGDEIKLSGKYVFEKTTMKEIEKATDDNYATFGGAKEDHYWWGYDLGDDDLPVVTRIEFCMRHDMNMIVAGDQYELFYYDYGWKSLGKQVANSDSLVYSGPKGALYWLRNLTGGREERIFTYENNRQIWW